LAHGFHTRYQGDDRRCFLTSAALSALAPVDKDFHIRTVYRVAVSGAAALGRLQPATGGAGA
jgi:hypothetical protein